MRNKIYAIVEGHGEASRPSPSQAPAVTLLTRKLLQYFGCRTLFPVEKVPPFRMNYGDIFAKSGKLENAIRYHTKFSDCAALLILIDMDDDCPKDKAFELVMRTKALGQLPFSVVVVCAKCEYEAWFLASLESIHPGLPYPGEPESKRDAKGWLKHQFQYRQTRDQASYTQKLDVELTRSRSRSFRRLCHAVEEMIDAFTHDRPILTPSPTNV